LWAWQWKDALALEHGFPGDDGPWAGCGDTPSDPSQGFAEEFFYYDDLGIVTMTLADPPQVLVCVRAYVYVYVLV